MNAPRCLTLFSLLAPAQPAADRGGVDKPLRYFIPPLLLRAGPHFFFAAVNTAKGSVDIEPTIYKVRRAVTIIRRQQCLIHRRTQHWSKLGLRQFGAQANPGRLLFSFGFNLGTLLFAAFSFHLAGSVLFSVIESPRP